MRSIMVITAWAAILLALVCILGVLGNTVPALEVFQGFSKPWMENVHPIISNLGSNVGLSSKSPTGVWITATLPMLFVCIVLALPGRKKMGNFPS